LAAESGSLVAAVRDIDLSSPEDLAEAGRCLNEALLPPGDAALVVDSSWRARLGTNTSDERLAPGQLVSWTTRFMNNPNPLADPLEGTFETSDGATLALAYRLPRDDGFLIVFRSANDVRISADDLAENFPLAGAIAFLWLGGLLSACTFLAGKRLHDELSGELDRSEERAMRREQALLRTRDAVIFGLAKLAESRDHDTGEHVERISLYCQRLAAAMRRRPEYREIITPSFVRLIEASSVLHDIGKVGITDAILHKPGALDSVERTEIQKHPVIGGDCLAEIERRLGASNFLQMAREIALFHHERWDGTGYPAGLKEEEIPLAARIVAIADNYDALVSRRPYKEPFSHETAVDLIRKGKGTQFDPRLVEVFLEIEAEFRDIARQYATAARLSLRVALDTSDSDTARPMLAAVNQ
jgi:HD-GYP domain-containing protein (c-di-GMP phosphodiesterase class II)